MLFNLFFCTHRAITLHAVLRLQPMLEQLKEGLQLYGLHLLIKQYPEICQPLFVLGGDVKVSTNVFSALHVCITYIYTFCYITDTNMNLFYLNSK